MPNTNVPNINVGGGGGEIVINRSGVPLLFRKQLIRNRLLICPVSNTLFQEQVVGNSILLCYSQFIVPGTINREQIIAEGLHTQ